MEPQIRYAKTSDGVNIAYYAIGSGMPYVWPATGPGTGVANMWRVPEMRNYYEAIARRATLVVYDTRGFGLSDRGPMDHSCAAMVRDLEAVADAAAPGPFTLQTFSYMSVPAVSYAARHPERLTALILLNGVLRTADMSESWKRLVQLARDDWDYATALIVRTNEASYASTETLEQFQEQFARDVPKDGFLAFCDAMESWDASELAGRIDTPVLVAHYGSQSNHIPLEACRHLAAALPKGTLATIELGRGENRGDRVSSVVRGFLRGVLAPPERETTRASLPSGTAIILFTDIADSTALTERMGDAAFRAASRRIDDHVRAAIRDAGGTHVAGKVLGDGVMGVFTSATQAIQAARRCVEVSGDLPLHIGLHAGDVIREDDNVYGGAVNIASRICGLCAPGEILVSATVRELARTSAGVTFEDRGEQPLKGIEDVVRVFVVRAG
jgi:class 3 adenylate cyclase